MLNEELHRIWSDANPAATPLSEPDIKAACSTGTTFEGSLLRQRSSSIVPFAAILRSADSEKNLEPTVKCDLGSEIGVHSAEVSSPIQSDAGLVEWDGKHDPQNPKNFSTRIKVAIGLVIGLMNFVVSFAISVFSGATGPLGHDDDPLSGNAADLGVSLFILGLAFGPALFGPASEFYGRKTPLVFGMIGFMGATISVTTSKYFEAVLICRFLSGFCGSAAYVIPPGMFVDLFGPVGRAMGYSMFATGAFIGGSLGPAIGVTLVSEYNLTWRWSMWLCVLIALPLTVTMLVLPETLEKFILQEKCRRLRNATGDWSLHCFRDETPAGLQKYLMKPWQMLIREPVLIVVTLAFTLDYGIQSLTYSAVPKAYEFPRHWGRGHSAWMLVVTIPGFVVGCIVVLVDTKIRFQKRLVAGKAIEPESRLPAMIAGMIILSLGLLYFAWKTSSSTHWSDPATAEVLIGTGMYLVWVTATVYIQDLYVEHANSALAACAFVRYAAGAALSTFSAPMYEKLGVHWMIGSLGVLCAVLVPLHILFYFCGKRVRGWSKFALQSRVHLEVESHVQLEDE
ncbi:MFS general substrate transporter [Lecanosticta acicola]|uniref:MFS general substrate transporter n=1 Tax=Lecanosticta acicola TaxID=111012 RepID=A0AAI8Z7V3_9PEZI|nr:MFS general substrate transporter [Lecanosticta acicola]